MCKCERCGFDYRYIEKNIGCTHKHGYFKDGMFYEPIKVGDPGDWCEGGDQNTRCCDCGAPIGTYHHVNCDAERCPICGGQLWTCGCFEYENEELAFAAINEILNKSKKNKISYEEILKILDKYDIKIED